MAFNLFLLKMRFSHFMSSIKEINFALSASFNYIYLPSSATTYWNNNPKVDYENKSRYHRWEIFFVCQGPKTTQEKSFFSHCSTNAEQKTQNAPTMNRLPAFCFGNLILLTFCRIQFRFFFFCFILLGIILGTRKRSFERNVRQRKIFY